MVGNLPTMRAGGVGFGGFHPPYGAGLKPGLRERSKMKIWNIVTRPKFRLT